MYRPVRITGHFANAGDKTTRHAHDNEHETGVTRGSAMVRMWDIRDERVQIKAFLVEGCSVTVPAEWKHEVEALEPDTMTYCSFPDSDGDPSGSHRLESEGKPWR